jgi:hypothetical protein
MGPVSMTLINSIPGIALTLWVVFLIWMTYQSHSRIVALQDKYDPHKEFVRQREARMRSNMNNYWVDRTHPLCTDEFLEEWNPVYRGFWWFVAIWFLMLPVIGYGSRFLRYVIKEMIEWSLG